MRNTYSFKMRTTAFIVAVLLVVSIFIADLFRIQIIDRDEYKAQAISLSSASSEIDALRGEILDSNGQALVYNVRSNSVYIDASYFPSSSKKAERNEILLSLVRLFEQNGIEYKSSLPIVYSNGNFVFAEDSSKDKKYLIQKDYLNLNFYATAQNCYDALCEFYEFKDMTIDETLKVGGILFEMRKGDFSKSNPFTLAENVPDTLVALLKEQSRFYRGIEIRVDTQRAFYDGTIAPHIIGYYDYISADEYERVTAEYKEKLKDESLTEEQKEELKLKAYGMTDKIGKFGIENAMENELRGTNGKLTTTVNSDGTKSTTVTKNPQNGNNVILTIKADFQKKVQDLLAARIDSTKGTKNVAAAGSIVVMDVKDFSVLACATYPSYDLNTYKENIVALNKDQTAPLWNRALRSTYEPGSTVKPAVALAGLEEGIITADQRIKCTGLYTFFSDIPFRCYNVGSHAGSEINVKQALRYSCNIFFYEVGRQLGISKMNEYFKMLGLGSKTGIELTEATGIVAGPEERQAQGLVWYPGDTVQAAIGQADNLFTPIQLAAYVSTLANGGTKYKAHFVKSIKSADYSETLYEAQPEVLTQYEFSRSSLQTVRDGMVMMGSSQAAFQGLPYQIAAKTGTAEAKRKVNGATVEFTNGFMISYAPADDPQIAVVIAIENVTSGGLGNYVRDVYEAYFNSGSGVTNSQQSGTVLN